MGRPRADVFATTELPIMWILCKPLDEMLPREGDRERRSWILGPRRCETGAGWDVDLCTAAWAVLF